MNDKEELRKTQNAMLAYFFMAIIEAGVICWLVTLIK